MESNKSLLKELSKKLEAGDASGVADLTRKALDQNIAPDVILNQALVPGMDEVGVKFKNNEVFIPEVLIAARAMKAGMVLIKPLLAESNVQSRGKVIIGTVKGDLHDIGKNIVSMLLEGAGFEVVNMGADVGIDQIIELIHKESPDVLGLSALLTTTMVYMREVIEALEKKNIRNRVKVIIGGAPITQAYANEIHADGYAPDAATSVDLVRNLLNIQN
jgi:5-methyltetrahydrofolate--homocysteine methyltransferase